MFDRNFTNRARVTGVSEFLAPSGGWVQSGNITRARPDQAEVLDNFIPTAEGARLRGGSEVYANLGASVVRLFSYASGGVEDLFGSTADSIFDVDRVNAGDATFAEVEGLGSGDWSVTQTATSGGQFLWGVNGINSAMYWDGSGFEPITSVAINDLGFDAQSAAFTVGEVVTGGTSGATATVIAITKTSATAGTLKLGTITGGPYQNNESLTGSTSGAATANGASSSGSTVTITGVATSTLTQCWLHKERIFAVEKNTMSAWYLPVESIGGSATELPLGAVFGEGGSLLFGATWSMDSGSGLDDVCLFVTDRGEVAVYEGSDPSSASTWQRIGVYKISKPINKHSFFKAGGDLAILTEDGIVPISKAISKDRAALQADAITYPIEEAWREAIANRTASYPITATLWQSKTLLIVGTPAKAAGVNVSFVSNARTGAWGRITGWDVRCSTVSGDQLYFGDSAGNVMKADEGGSDNGTQFTGTYVPRFEKSTQARYAKKAKLTYRARTSLDLEMACHSDYQVDAIAPPGPSADLVGDVWGTGVWGAFVWGSASTLATFTEWQKVRAGGYSLAPSVSITSNQTNPLVFEIMALSLMHESGAPL